MKTVGFIGGMSWESTVTYYKIVNEIVKQKLGGLQLKFTLQKPQSFL